MQWLKNRPNVVLVKYAVITNLNLILSMSPKLLLFNKKKCINDFLPDTLYKHLTDL